jgi:hypothetical protein
LKYATLPGQNFLDAEIAQVEKLIAQQALSWPEIRRLMTVLGVNLIRTSEPRQSDDERPSRLPARSTRPANVRRA